MGLNNETMNMLMWFQMLLAHKTGKKVKAFGMSEIKKGDIIMKLSLGDKLTDPEKAALADVNWAKQFGQIADWETDRGGHQ